MIGDLNLAPLNSSQMQSLQCSCFHFTNSHFFCCHFIRLFPCHFRKKNHMHGFHKIFLVVVCGRQTAAVLHRREFCIVDISVFLWFKAAWLCWQSAGWLDRWAGRPADRQAGGQASPGRLGPAIGKRKITERRTRNR